jgi:DNA adenine methylase
LKTSSPLRYPGGKANLSDFLRSIITRNNIENGVYFELYAGGAGAALELLFSGIIDKIVLNDADYHIYAFWHSILNETDAFIALINETNIDLDAWFLQREIYGNPDNHSILEVGFSTFFLNRTNRSGILPKAGPIGGFGQDGKYKIDARFNKLDLIKRIRKIHSFRDKIEIHNEDTLSFIAQNLDRFADNNSFIYLDPPYYNKGKSLYLNFYTHDDHEKLRDLLSQIRRFNWIVSYDDVAPIKELYNGFRTSLIDLNYSLQNKRKTTEFCIYSDNIELN